MTLNKSKGHMYPWCDFTWTPIKGACAHSCVYCFMKQYPVGELRLDRKALNDDLGKAQTIFVGSSTDMWADAVPSEWIREVLWHCRKYPNTTFLFQTKNPYRFRGFLFPPNSILGTTLESNRFYPGISAAPSVGARTSAMAMEFLHSRKMISIEPIMDFDLSQFVAWINAIQPEFVSVGADSRRHGLPEPRPDKVIALIEALKEFTQVRIKSNLARLMKETQ